MKLKMLFETVVSEENSDSKEDGLEELDRKKKDKKEVLDTALKDIGYDKKDDQKN